MKLQFSKSGTWWQLWQLDHKLRRIPISAVAGICLGLTYSLHLHHVSWWPAMLAAGVVLTLINPVLHSAVHHHYFSKRAIQRAVKDTTTH
jgi:fatty acid desaturase